MPQLHNDPAVSLNNIIRKGNFEMSPEQLKVLQRLSQLFEEGRAGPSQIRELSSLLTAINQNQDRSDVFANPPFSHARSSNDTL